MDDGKIHITSFDGVSLGGAKEAEEPEEMEETVVVAEEEEVA